MTTPLEKSVDAASVIAEVSVIAGWSSGGALLAHSDPAEDSVDPVVVRYVGGEFASYIDTDSAAPFAGRIALLHWRRRSHNSQVLNTAIALSNVVALLALSLAQDESEVDLVAGSIRRSAAVAFP